MPKPLIKPNLVHTLIDVSGVMVRLETTPKGDGVRIALTFGSGVSVGNFIAYVPIQEFAKGLKQTSEFLAKASEQVTEVMLAK